MGSHYLDRLFAPHSIAVFGASERPEAVGARVFENILAAGYEGSVFPINPARDRIGEHDCHRDLASVGWRVDLAVIATPAATVPEIIHQCGEHGVRGAIVLSAGFEEGDGRGAGLQKAMLQEARRYRMRILGPNCLGLARPSSRLNATFSKNQPSDGSLALVSQSGALCTAILDWAESRRVGFSAVVSVGGAADVGFGDVLDYLALDGRTRGILVYVEGIRHRRRFMSGLRAAARLKPVIVVKAGRRSAGSLAAVSHTGALVGGDDAFQAALRRAGAVRAGTIEQLFAAAELLSMHHRAHGNRLAIVTNGGGPGVLAADRAAELGLPLAELGTETLRRLDDALPRQWSRGNPVDVLGDAPPERFHASVAACLADAQVDGVLAMLTPQAMTAPLDAARAVAEAAAGQEKPVLTCWMGGAQVAAARELFVAEGVPTFPSPETSVEAFSYLARYRENQQLLLQVPGPVSREEEPDLEGARLIIENALAERRTTLSAAESKALLTAFRIPVVRAVEVETASEALVAAESLGFPVALKINSPDISHKSDVGGVRLDVSSAHEVRQAFQDLIAHVRARRPDAAVRGATVESMHRRPNGRELLVGVALDPAFGPVIGFGAGGTATEILRDRAVALPPLNGFIVRDMIRRTRISRQLEAFRDKPAVNLAAVERVLVRVSEMVCELPQIRELDINPLVADEEGAVAVDARVVVALPAPTLERYGHMAIHPYPIGLLSRHGLADGTELCIRPIRPEDAEIEATFVRNLSPRSKYFRFMSGLTELTQEMLVRFTQIDYDREMAFIGVVERDGAERQVGVARYVTNPDGETCEFALVVADEWQRKGIGSRLMGALMAAAKARGLVFMNGEVLGDNHEMLALVRGLGFTARTCEDDPSVQLVTKEL